MAFEYQQMDVTNESVSMITGWMSQFGWNLKNSQRVFSRSSRPIGAITYQNFTYIQTETEVEDFTELLFERDLDMTFYDEVLELEQEANYLMEYHTEARPLPCPPPKSYDEWYKINKPSPFGLGTQILIAIISAIVLGVTIGLLCRLRYDKEFVEGLFTPIFITAIVLSIIISCALKAFVQDLPSSIVVEVQ